MGLANKIGELKDASDENDIDASAIAMLYINERLRTLQVTMTRIADSLDAIVQILEDQTYEMESQVEEKPPAEERKPRASKKEKEKEKDSE